MSWSQLSLTLCNLTYGNYKTLITKGRHRLSVSHETVSLVSSVKVHCLFDPSNLQLSLIRYIILHYFLYRILLLLWYNKWGNPSETNSRLHYELLNSIIHYYDQTATWSWSTASVLEYITAPPVPTWKCPHAPSHIQTILGLELTTTTTTMHTNARTEANPCSQVPPSTWMTDWNQGSGGCYSSRFISPHSVQILK